MHSTAGEVNNNECNFGNEKINKYLQIFNTPSDHAKSTLAATLRVCVCVCCACCEEQLRIIELSL